MKALPMKRLILLAVLLIASPLCASSTDGAQLESSNQESFVTRAVFAEGQLWVLSDHGQLFRITEGKDAPVEQRLPEPAREMALLHGRPAGRTCKTESCTRWRLRVWDDR